VAAAPANNEEAAFKELEECRKKATSSVEECACFPGCRAVPTQYGTEFIGGNISETSALAKHAGCGNRKAYIQGSNEKINMGTATPQSLHTTIFEKCHEHGCDINPTTKKTTIITGNNRLTQEANVDIYPRGFYRDWNDHDAACTLLRGASYLNQEIVERRPYSNCRPGMDCDLPANIKQYYQFNYFQVDHWDSCGHQSHVEALVTVDQVATEAKSCNAAVDIMRAGLAPLMKQFEILFGLIQFVCP
jgi:hypothetical protein